MENFFSALSSPGNWTQTQWLAVAIGLFVLVASFYFIWKLYDIIRNAGKSTYTPNIGRARLNNRPGQRPGTGIGSEGQGISKPTRPEDRRIERDEDA